MINHLSERLQSAEEAIFEAEEAISHERSYRKRITQELKDRNAELRQLVDNEKKKLSDKVHEELEVTLKQALKEKMAAEDSLEGAKAVMIERDMMFEEVDGLFLTLRDEHKSSAKITADQQKVIEHLEEELQSTKEEKDKLQTISDERQSQIDKLNTDLDEAYGVISKLEEARIVLNRLLGPDGVMTERERQKFLKPKGNELDET